MRLAWLLLCLTLPLQAAQTVYRWVDAQGTVHYSDQPQPGGQSETLQMATPPQGKPVKPAPVQTSPSTTAEPQEPLGGGVRGRCGSTPRAATRNR